MSLNKRARKNMAAVGFFFTGLVLLFVVGGAWGILDRYAYFSPSIQRDRCVQNLERIAQAKDEYRDERRLTNGTLVTADQLRDYVEGGERGLRCPGKGTYTIHPLGQAPECSEPGHAIPQNP
jgi:hypothetical protein